MHEDLSVLAAEHVLRLYSPAKRRIIFVRSLFDYRLRAEIQSWECRTARLDDDFKPSPPPLAAFKEIEDRLFARPWYTRFGLPYLSPVQWIGIIITGLIALKLGLLFVIGR